MAFGYQTPESQGIHTSDVYALLQFMKNHIFHPDALIIARNGAIVTEAYWKPFGPGQKHIIQSASKSFTALAMGFLIDEGRVHLDDKMVDFFPERLPSYYDKRLNKITIRDLLMMAASIARTPAIFTGVTSSWITDYFSLPLVNEPGTTFRYDTGGSMMLSAIISRVTGKSAHTLLKERVFHPMGIFDTSWATIPEKANPDDPEYISAGGWGLSMTAHDLAKIAQLLLDKGNYKGRQLIPAWWIEEATKKHIDNAKNAGRGWPDGYGYQIWRAGQDSFAFCGSYGQFMIANPKKNMFVITFSSNPLADSPMMGRAIFSRVIDKASDTPLPPNPADNQILQRYIQELTLPMPQGDAMQPCAEDAYFERQYVFSGENYRNLRAVSFERVSQDTIRIDMDIFHQKVSVYAGYNHWCENPIVLPRDIEYNLLPQNENRTQAYAYAWENPHTLKVTHSVVNSLSDDFYTFAFGEQGVTVNIRQNAYYDDTHEETFANLQA